jgi:hypothetical protein
MRNGKQIFIYERSMYMSFEYIPLTGIKGRLYFTEDTQKLYKWNGRKYKVIKTTIYFN